MGYTHYYEIKGGWQTPEWQEAWPKLIQDTSLILKATDAPITGNPSGEVDYKLNKEIVEPPIVDIKNGIQFNGVEGDACEPFILNEEICQDEMVFCKTRRLRYDTPVACILLRAYMLAPNSFDLSSDGFWEEDEWKNARALYQKVYPGEPIECPKDMIADIETSSEG